MDPTHSFSGIPAKNDKRGGGFHRGQASTMLVYEFHARFSGYTGIIYPVKREFPV
jgi:hypothetical protein